MVLELVSIPFGAVIAEETAQVLVFIFLQGQIFRVRLSSKTEYGLEILSEKSWVKQYLFIQDGFNDLNQSAFIDS